MPLSCDFNAMMRHFFGDMYIYNMTINDTNKLIKITGDVLKLLLAASHEAK